MIVDALIVTSRNFKSIFVYQRFHVPPCAPSVQTFEICKKRLFFLQPLSPKSQVRYWFGLLPTLTGPNCLIAFRKTCIFWISNPQATQSQISKLHTQEIKGGACRFGLKSRQTLGFKGHKSAKPLDPWTILHRLNQSQDVLAASQGISLLFAWILQASGAWNPTGLFPLPAMEGSLFWRSKRTQLLSIFEGKNINPQMFKTANGGSRIPLGHTASANMEADAELILAQRFQVAWPIRSGHLHHKATAIIIPGHDTFTSTDGEE